MKQSRARVSARGDTELARLGVRDGLYESARGVDLMVTQI
jgi:hypothetical protein